MYDVPILLEFFARPDTFKRVFDEIVKIQPKQLFLYQDGPRENRPDDLIKIQKCREILKGINWPCDIKTFFQDKNVGCDPSGFIAQSWFFSNVEYGIVLEDDCVPSAGFFEMCRILLPKYKEDERVAFISGMNILGDFKNIDTPYFFTAHGGIWGWASWKRFYSKCDPNYTWLDNKEVTNKIASNFYSKIEGKQFIELAKKRRSEGKAYFETIVYANARMNGMLEIVPKYNTIENIGVTVNSAHTGLPYAKMTSLEKKFYFQKTFDFSNSDKEIPVQRNTLYERKIHWNLFQKFYVKVRSKIIRVLQRGFDK